MKHDEIYDKHADRKHAKGPKKKFKESNDPAARARRVSFKSYVRELEEELLEDGFDDLTDDPQEL